MNTMPLAAEKAESVSLRLVLLPSNAKLDTARALYNLALSQRRRAGLCRREARSAEAEGRLADYRELASEARRNFRNAQFNLRHARMWKQLGSNANG